MNEPLVIFSPSGVVAEPVRLRRAVERLKQHGFAARLDTSALARRQRFAGGDDERLAALHRVARAGVQGEVSIALASRGGYGLTRLLDRIDWPLLCASVEHGLRWVGYSDMTGLQLLQAGVLAQQKAVLLGRFTASVPTPLDRGYTLKAAIAHLRSACPVPIVTGLPFGHVPTKVCLPVGRRATLAVQGREAFIGW